MQWYLSIILKMYTSCKEGLGSAINEQERKLVEGRLEAIDEWIRDSLKESLPYGAVFILIFILEKRFKRLSKAEVCSLDNIENLVVAAYMLAWRSYEEWSVWATDFLKTNPLNYKLKQLMELEKDFLKKIEYEVIPFNPHEVAAIIKKYCDKQTRLALHEMLWRSKDLHIADYVIATLDLENITIEFIKDRIQQAPTARHIELFLHYLRHKTGEYLSKGHMEEVIKHAQQKVLELAYRQREASEKSPKREAIYHQEALAILSLPTIDGSDRSLKAEYLGLRQAPKSLSEDWLLYFVVKNLNRAGIVYPFGFSREYDEHLCEILKMAHMRYLFQVKSMFQVAFLTAKYLEVLPKGLPINALAFAKFYIGCLVADSNIKSVPFALSTLFNNQLDFKDFQSAYEQFLAHPKVKDEVAERRDKSWIDFVTMEFDDETFQRLCRGLMGEEQELNDSLMKTIVTRMKCHGAESVASIIYCLQTPEQLEQLRVELKKRDYNHLRDDRLRPPTLFQPESEWGKIEVAFRVMEKTLGVAGIVRRPGVSRDPGK